MLAELTRAEVRHLLDHPDEAWQRTGAFLAFLMLPVAERFGQWRFAGAAPDLGEALRLIDALGWAIRPPGLEGEGAPLEVLRQLTDAEVMCFPEDGPEFYSSPAAERDLGAGRYVIFAEGGAPYDHVGFAVFEVPTLEGHPYASRRRESKPPRSWHSSDMADFDADLDAHPDVWLED